MSSLGSKFLLKSFSPVVKKIQDSSDYMHFKMKEKDMQTFSTFMPPVFAILILLLFILMYFAQTMIGLLCDFSLLEFLGLILAVALLFLLSSQIVICNVSGLQSCQANRKKRALEKKERQRKEKERKEEDRKRKAEEKKR